ncbi:WD repeat domain phosphoinositide-interacting protein 3 [Hordeum vulgare]|nr:WD repeat domain phosphoinositide-interacting protein 3 [Hordeum vulgare]
MVQSKVPSRASSAVKVVPPEEGWLKVNSDHAVSKIGDKGGAGAVIRNHEGAFRAGLCYLFRGVVDPESVEILACKRDLQVAWEINADKVHVEMDP